MVAKRCSIERSSQRASCRWRAIDWLAPLRLPHGVGVGAVQAQRAAAKPG
jgi:hypothetical protein